MEIVKKIENKVLVLDVIGRLDTNTAPELEASVKSEISEVKKMELNLKELNYISSAGLRVILIFHKQLTANGGKLFVLNPKEEVMDVFDMTGFSSFLNIEER